MPAIDTRADPAEDDIEVLVTGFGPFGKVAANPSFLCTKGLHDTYIETVESSSAKRRVHIQTIQTATAYAHILDLVPHVHGHKPSAPEASPYLDPKCEQPDPRTGLGPQGNGRSFPEGYRSIRIPPKGRFDHVIHVGVGYKGSVQVETQAHKTGYRLPDVKGEKAPIVPGHLESASKNDALSEPEKREHENMQVSQSESSALRGFGRGYEGFSDEISTRNNVPGLIQWLKETRKHEHVRQSTDAGRFLCDFIFYCSLAEAQRGGDQTKVQFIHVPPEHEPYTIDQLTAIVKDSISWLVSQ